jgi:hypothetical protein
MIMFVREWMLVSACVNGCSWMFVIAIARDREWMLVTACVNGCSWMLVIAIAHVRACFCS